MARGLVANRAPIHGRRGPGTPGGGDGLPAIPATPSAPTFSGATLNVDGVSFSTISAAIAAASAGDKIRVSISYAETAFTVDKSLEIYGVGNPVVSLSSTTNPVVISSTVANVYIHDLTLTATQPRGFFAPVISALSQTSGTPNGQTGYYFKNLVINHGFIGIYVAAAGWVVEGCTFACNQTNPGADVYGIVDGGSSGTCAIKSNTFRSTLDANVYHCVFQQTYSIGGNTSGHAGSMVVQSNTVVEDSAGVEVVGFIERHNFNASGSAAGVAGGYSMYLASNTVTSYRQGSLLYLASDASDGVDPLTFFDVLYLVGNSVGSSSTQNKGVVQVSYDTAGVPAVLRPTGRPTNTYASGNTAAAIGASWTNCSSVANLIACLGTYYYATNPLIVPANLGSQGTYNPNATPGIYLWYRSDTVSTTGGVVDSVTDKSATGINATSSGTARPAYTANDAAYNNQPSLTFDGVDDTLLASSANYSSHTILQVCRSAGQAGYRPFYRRVGASTNDIDYCSHRTDALFIRNNALTASYKTNATNWGVTANPITIRVQYDGTHAGHLLWKNGSAVSLTSATANDPGALATGNLRIMSDASTWTSGTWAEMIIFSRVLTASESADVEAYLRSRYAHY